MKANREKTAGMMGFVVSILLHGIFFAGCIAIDYTKTDSSAIAEPTEMNQVTDQADSEKTKS